MKNKKWCHYCGYDNPPYVEGFSVRFVMCYQCEIENVSDPQYFNAPIHKGQIDNGFKENGKPLRRFYLNRIKDETGVSRTGRVLEGVLTQTGKVITEWRPPHSTMGIYNSLQEFMTIHVDCHPSCNEVVWID